MRHHMLPRLPKLGSLSSALIGVVLSSTVATAADLDPGYADVPAPIPQQMVSFGSGWYIRGDIAGTRAENLSPTKPTFDTTDPTSIPVAPNLSTRQGSDYGYALSLGGGYKFTNWFRADAIFDYTQPRSTNIAGAPSKCPGAFDQFGKLGLQGCQAHYAGNLNSYDILVNGYLDIGTYGIISPYIGVGAGLAFGNYNTAATYTQSDGTAYDITVTDPTTGTAFHENFDAAKSGRYYNFAYALMAGAAIDIYDHTKLDIGYRYLNLGNIKGVTTSPMYQHQIRAGIRYMIDN